MTVRCREETDKGEGDIEEDDRTADDAISLMEEKYELLKTLFHQGYRTLLPNGMNPLRSPQNHACLDEASQTFATEAGAIIDSYSEPICAASACPLILLADLSNRTFPHCPPSLGATEHDQ